MTDFARKLKKAVDKVKPTDWQTATVPARGAVDFRQHIEQRLDDFMFRESAPIRAIIGAPTDLYVAATLSNSALLVALMDNMYAYGRANWKWVRGSPAGKYCVDMGEEPGDPDRFSNWALTDRESLTAQEMKTLATWSSCG